MRRILIDTNIYLNFYRIEHPESLDMLRELSKLVDSGDFQVVLPQQVEDEFSRNKFSKTVIHQDQISNFKKSLSVKLKTPHLIKKSTHIDQIRRTVEKLNGLAKKAEEDYRKRVYNPKSRINQALTKVFRHAMRPSESSDLLQRAYFRTIRGNPPRKHNDSFGDAIIWESILDSCIDQDLVIVSSDGDFESEIEQGNLNEFLFNEWKQKSSFSLSFFPTLGEFINSQSRKKKKPIPNSVIEEERGMGYLPRGSFDRFSSVGIGLVEGVNSLGTGILDAISIGIESFTCACCGEQVTNSFGALRVSMFPGNCSNCQSFTSSKNCTKCGSHFHEDVFSVSYTGALSFGGELCKICRFSPASDLS